MTLKPIRPIRASVAALLARHGIEAGAEGYALATLAAAAEARGWSWRTEELGQTRPGTNQYQALVWRRGATAGPRPWVTSYAGRGRGVTEEAALAVALARMLAREG